MKRRLHIVALEVPYPLVHGGLFDLFYKLAALHQQGIGIVLHCFTAGSNAQPTLHQYCEEVFYYRRKTGLRGLSLSRPYIVSSRENKTLADRLLADDHPILLEGIHCTAVLNDGRLSGRRTVLRLHNVEFQYYRQLFHHSESFFKKIYYLAESVLLKRYEMRIAKKVTMIAAVSSRDAVEYSRLFHAENVAVLPVFTGFQQADMPTGTGGYCLYHGNLSVVENESVALWLINEVFNELPVPLVIAGRAPSRRLIDTALFRQVNIIADPSADKMEEIIANAQLNVLPSFGRTGVKLKLLHALYSGRHCIVNRAAVAGTGLEGLCIIAEDADAFRNAVTALYTRLFTAADAEERRQKLSRMFDEERNVRQLIHWLW